MDLSGEQRGERAGSRWLLAASCAFAAAAAMPAAASAGVSPKGTPQGQLYGVTDRGPIPIPLIGTEVTAHLFGSVANVTVKQTFQNPNVKPLEAIYVFPLPHDASVYGLDVLVGDKRIKGDIKRRSEALRIYNQAKKSARVATLLDQERPNIFTQAIANVMPKSTVVVEVAFDVPLSYADGFYHFVFPMVVGPRAIPGDPNGKPSIGWGESPDTDRVPDASKITPPQAPAAKRSGRNISLGLTLRPGASIREIDSPTHAISTTDLPSAGKHAMRVELANRDEIPNRDFVLRYRLAETRPAMAAISHKDARGGFFTFRFEPPARPEAGDVAAKELIFVVDSSSAMAGLALEHARAAIGSAIDNLNGDDTFHILSLAANPSALSAAPLANTRPNRERAKRYLADLVAMGEADLRDGVASALETARTGDRLRIVSVITTGMFGNEAEILGVVREKLGARDRIFSLGVGAAPNRFLLEQLADLGRGDALYMLASEPVAAQVERFGARLRSPVLTDVEIDWKGLAVNELRPARLPDLFAGQPLALVGRYKESGQATVEVRGRMGNRRVVYEVPVTLGAGAASSAGSASTKVSGGVSGASIARLWARAVVRELELQPELQVEQIARLGVGFQIITSQTSFVAVADAAQIAPGDLQTIVVPVDAPADNKKRSSKLANRPERPEKPLADPAIEPAPGAAEKTRDKRELEKPAEPTTGATAANQQEIDGRVVDEDGDDSEGDGVGDDDDDGDLDAPRVDAETRVAAGAPADSTESLGAFWRNSRDSSVGRRWRFGVGVGLGATSNADAGESAFAAVTTLTLDRAVNRRIALGAGLALLVRGPEADRVIGNLLVSASALDLSLTHAVRFELSAGVGPSVSSDGAGIGLMGALKLYLPIPVGLQLRYDGALRFGDDESTATVTGGFEFSF